MTALDDHRRLQSLVEGEPSPPPVPRTDLPEALADHPWAPYWRPASRHTCALLLGHVVGTNGYGHTVGLRYSEIVDIVRELHPGCLTTSHTLRWYAGQIRAGDLPDASGRPYGPRLPQYRPRSAPSRT